MEKNMAFVIILALATMISTMVFAQDLNPTQTKIYQLFLPAADNGKILS